MCELILISLLLFLSLFSVINFMYKLRMCFIKPSVLPKSVMTVYVCGEDAVPQFYYEVEKYRWYGKEFADELSVISDGRLDEECYALAKAIGNIRITERQEYEGG